MASLFPLRTFPSVIQAKLAGIASQMQLGPGTSRAFVVAAVVLPLVQIGWLRIVEDYTKFINLGPGGTPSTPLGYFKITLLKYFVAHSPGQALQPPPSKADDWPSPYFSSENIALIPQRGTRPVIEGIAPQRQRDQKPSQEVIAELAVMIRNLAEENPQELQIGSSCFEKNNLALFLGPGLGSVNASRTQPASQKASLTPSSFKHALIDSDIEVLNKTCGSPPEIAHMHNVEGSLHLVLHPKDAAVVIEQGWAQKHPLAGTGGFVRDFFHGRFYKIFLGEGPLEGWLPRGFVLIYAPRNAEERQVIKEIIKAGAWWVGGVRLRS